MKIRHLKVTELAFMAGCDCDEVLVYLWDIGIDYIGDSSDYVKKKDITKAKKTLGIPTTRDFLSPHYWKEIFHASDGDFNTLLSNLNIKVKPNARRLPKGAPLKLRKEAQRRNVLSTKKTDIVKGENYLEKPFIWEQIGHLSDLRLLDADEVLNIHYALIDDLKNRDEPIFAFGPRNIDLLESSVFRTMTALGNEGKYQTVELAAAALLHSVVQNHPFHDGNKRTALISMAVFLDVNGYIITCDEKELFRLVILLAQHKLVPISKTYMADREVKAIAEFFDSNTRLIQKGDRTISWRRLKKILTAYGCTYEIAHGVGNRINIKRKLPKRRFQERKELNTQVKYTDDGRNASINTISKIRRDLQLDELHNIDSRSFYQMEQCSPNDFINRYRKTLKKLSKL